MGGQPATAAGEMGTDDISRGLLAAGGAVLGNVVCPSVPTSLIF
jgi:hypothetical protein